MKSEHAWLPVEASPLSRDNDLAALSARITLLQHIFALRCAFTHRSDCFVGRLLLQSKRWKACLGPSVCLALLRTPLEGEGVQEDRTAGAYSLAQAEVVVSSGTCLDQGRGR